MASPRITYNATYIQCYALSFHRFYAILHIGGDDMNFEITTELLESYISIYHQNYIQSISSISFSYSLLGYALDQLVTVSSMHCYTSTSVLSTSSSSRGLTTCVGISHLEGGFTLRCLQRLSLPDLATRPCPCQDNRYTRGQATPVLSY